ncbi:MAG: flavodoxin family protein [Clostridiales bacterium]|nr:flavodoxin family protein [Clostridiales bacterium]
MNTLIINCSPVRNGATAKIVSTVADCLSSASDIKTVCIDDYKIYYCKGCRTCHETAQCVQTDDVDLLMAEFEWADVIVSVAPSYWADVPGQFKVFIDRCTPWSNTHEPHRKLSSGKRGYAIALRTGPNMKECEKIIQSIEHFYGHLEIEAKGHLGLVSVEYKEDLEARMEEITGFAGSMIMN